MLLPPTNPDLDPRSLQPAQVLVDGSRELHEQVRQRIVEPGGLYFLSKFLCGFFDLTVEAHLALSLFYEHVGHDILAAVAEFPKSHLKTTIGTIAKILHHFSCRVIKGEDPIDRLAIASNTKENAMRMLRLMKQVPENNRLFQAFIPELLPEFSNEDVWNQKEIVFPRVRSFTDPSVDTLGVGGTSTSRHYTGIVEDDMLAEEDADSPTAIRKAIQLHQYYTSLLVDKDSWYLINEHAWTEYDLNKHVIENEPDTAVFSVGATRGFNEKRSRHVPEDIVERCRVWATNGCVWEARYDPDQLLKRRQKAGARIYNAVYENDPFDPDVVDFREEWLRYYEFNKNGDIRILPSKGIPMEIVKRSELYTVAAYDPALSKKTDASRSALAIAGMDPQERVFLLDDWAVRDDPLKLIDQVFRRVLKWNVQRCGVESVVFSKVIYDLLEERCRVWNARQQAQKKTNFVWPGLFEEVKPPKGQIKEGRIRQLVGTIAEAGRLYIRRDLVRFIDEYLHFPLGRTMDILDALAYCSLLWAPGVTEEDVAALQEEEDAYLASRDAVTGY